MELLTPAIGLLFWMALVFGILVFFLKKFAWLPILSSLKEREDSIESALRMAEETRAEMAKLKSDNDKILAEARAERDKMIRDAKGITDKMIADAKDKAVLEGNKIIGSNEVKYLNEKIEKTIKLLVFEEIAKIAKQKVVTMTIKLCIMFSL